MKKFELLNLANTTLDKKVKIAGTNWDRRRKLTNKEIYEIKRMYKRGKPISDIASRFGVAVSTIKYHLFEDYKKEHNQRRKDYVNNSSSNNRAERINYKRYLINNNKKVLVN